MTNQIPSRDPANDDSLVGLFRQVLDKFIQNTDDMLPARVVAVSGNRVQVQPLIMLVTTGGENVTRAQIIDLPIHRPGAGGFMLLFPVRSGDLGWIKASDRDISLFLQSWQESPPNTFRKHSFSDAVFIPDVMRGWTLDEADADRAVLQSIDGNCRVSVGSEDIIMTVGAASLTIAADAVTSTVPIHAPDFVTPSVSSYNDHTHSGVTTGPGSTGAPNP